MTTPKTVIIYSVPLNRLFLRNFGRKETHDLCRDTESFRILHNENIYRDLELISRFTGFDWEKTYIPIYIVRDCLTSISNPLILKCDENPHLMYVMLLHELAHINLERALESARPGHEMAELYVNATVREVLYEPPSRTEMTDSAMSDENWKKMLGSGLRLRGKTVRDCLQRSS